MENMVNLFNIHPLLPIAGEAEGMYFQFFQASFGALFKKPLNSDADSVPIIFDSAHYPAKFFHGNYSRQDLDDYEWRYHVNDMAKAQNVASQQKECDKPRLTIGDD